MSLIEDNGWALSHLVTTIETSEPAIREILASSTNPKHQAEANVVRALATNIAPLNPDGPQIVFVGLNFTVRGPRVDAMRGRRSYQTVIDWSERPPRQPTNHVPQTQQRNGGDPFPVLTTVEAKLGIYLFPGEWVTCEYVVPSTEVHDVGVRGGGERVSAALVLHPKDTAPLGNMLTGCVKQSAFTPRQG